MRLIEACGALTTDQVRVMMFAGMKSGERVCQRRLAALSKASNAISPRLRSRRYSLDSPNVYFAGKRPPAQVEHRLAVNWVRAWFGARLSQWEELRWQYEQDYGVLRCDAFAAVKNRVTGKWRGCFIEVDRSANEWDKTARYTRLWEADGYMAAWWAGLVEHFPAVLVACESEARARMISQAVREGNPRGLEFQVRLLEHLRSEAVNCATR